MRLFGFEVRRTKAHPMRAVDDSRGWTTLFSTGPDTFQTGADIRPGEVDKNWVVWACKTLIAGDVGKMRIKLVEWDGRIWKEVTDSPAFNPVLRKPNTFQTRQQFIEQWIFSLLGNGNTYVLKERDNRGVAVRLYVLDPTRVKPLVAPDGSIYYELQEDLLAKVPMGLPAIPASEIIHDRQNCLFHPLVGLPALFANGLAATQGLKIQGNSEQFFRNMSRPSGILTSPGSITQALATEYKKRWTENYGGANIGQVAVLGNDLKYQPLAVNAVDAQMVEQLKLSAEMICSTFHMPAYKVGVGPIPVYQSAEILNQIYYNDCLQKLIEAIEALLDEGLGLVNVQGRTLGVEFDLKGLLRMDTAAQIAVLNESVKGGWYKPNEARAEQNLPPVEGGDTPYLQQQNFGLGALARRDASPDPFSTATPAAPASDPTKAIAEAIETMGAMFVEREASIASPVVASVQSLVHAIEKSHAERAATEETAVSDLTKAMQSLGHELRSEVNDLRTVVELKADPEDDDADDLALALIAKFAQETCELA